MTSLTDEERSMMRHALGADGKLPGYRNVYVTEDDAPAGLVWEGLVARGLAQRGRVIPGGLVPYRVTMAGQELIGITVHP